MPSFNPQQGLVSEQGRAAKSGRRRTGRLETESVASNLGAVLNLSSGGMRVLCRKVPRNPVGVELIGCGAHLKLRGEVAWVQRVGFFQKVVGIHFVDLTQEQTNLLTSLAMTNTVRRVIA
jgi:hypothetical protein